MIAHVATAGEDRGRVVVRLGACTSSSSAAVSAAVHVARAFHSEIEALFIEDPDMLPASQHDRVRVVSTTGIRRAMSARSLAVGLGHFATATQREVAGLARAAGVHCTGKTVRSEPVEALTAACAERGPWNIIAFAEPIASPASAEVLNDALVRVWGTTAFIAAGRIALWRSGPIVVVVEDIERLSGLVRAAERLAAIGGDEVYLLPSADDEIALDWLESEIRLSLGSDTTVKLLPRSEPVGQPEAVRAALDRLRPRLVLARHGGVVVPTQDTGRALSALQVPVFIVH